MNFIYVDEYGLCDKQVMPALDTPFAGTIQQQKKNHTLVRCDSAWSLSLHNWLLSLV
jgi:hypothetical protein